MSSRGGAPPVTLERGHRSRAWRRTAACTCRRGCRRSMPRHSPARSHLPEIARARLRDFFAGDRLQPHARRDRRCGARSSRADHRGRRAAATRCSRSSSSTGRPPPSRISARASWPRACSAWKPRRRTPLTILVATSGDTGGAVAAAFHRRPWVRVVILYPKGLVSPRQEQQLTCWGENVASLRIDGTFDDCQRLVKEAFGDPALGRAGTASAPPTASTSAGCCRRWSTTRPRASRSSAAPAPRPSYIIPAGNLGNAFAAVWARALGLSHRAHHPGAQRQPHRARFPANRACGGRAPALRRWPRPWTWAIPATWSACARCIRRWSAMREQLSADSVDDATIRARIGEDFMQYGREWCPHTATAAEVYSRLSAAERRDASLGGGGHGASRQIQRNRRAHHRQARGGSRRASSGCCACRSTSWTCRRRCEALAAALE